MVSKISDTVPCSICRFPILVTGESIQCPYCGVKGRVIKRVIRGRTSQEVQTTPLDWFTLFLAIASVALGITAVRKAWK